MDIQFEGMTGERRKELVKAISEVTGEKSIYQGSPSFGYQIGSITIRKDGGLEADDSLDTKGVGHLLNALQARGFTQQGEAWKVPEETPATEEHMSCTSMRNIDGITLTFPKEGMNQNAISNLKKLVEGKGWLIRMALEVGELPVEENEDTLRFSWLPSTAPHEMTFACMHLIATLIKLAKKQKRVVLTVNETDNPRYALRCFLLRLGFIGNEYKAVRKILLKGVPGNGSSRHPEDNPIRSEESDRP